MKGRDSSLRSEWHQKSTQNDKNKTGVLNLSYEILRCAQNDNKKMLRMTNITYTVFLFKFGILNVVKDLDFDG